MSCTWTPCCKLLYLSTSSILIAYMIVPHLQWEETEKKWFQILGFDLHLPEVPGLTPQYSDKQMFSPYS